MTSLPILQKPEARRPYVAPSGLREHRPPLYVVRPGVEGPILVVERLNARCDQEIAAYWKPGIIGTAKTLGAVYIQPKDMEPSGVSKCSCNYTIAIQLPGDAAVEALKVFHRGDAYAGPPSEWKRIQRIAPQRSA